MGYTNNDTAIYSSYYQTSPTFNQYQTNAASPYTSLDSYYKPSYPSYAYDNRPSPIYQTMPAHPQQIFQPIQQPLQQQTPQQVPQQVPQQIPQQLPQLAMQQVPQKTNQQPPLPIYFHVPEKKEYKNEYLKRNTLTRSDSVYDQVYAFNVSSSVKNLEVFAKETEIRAEKKNQKKSKSNKELAGNDHQNKSRTKHQPPPKITETKKSTLKKSLTQKKLPKESYINKSSNKKSKSAGVLNKNKQAGLTATEDVDKLLEDMGYSLPLLAEAEEPMRMDPKKKQDLMFSYGLTEEEFDKADLHFNEYCQNGKFAIKNLVKVFPNNSLADRIQLPDLTDDDGDFLKFEEYLNIYQILKDLDL